MGPTADSGGKGPREAKKVPRVTTGTPLLESLSRARDINFGLLFLMLFRGPSFLLPGPALRAQSAQKAPKMNPKWSRKDA